MKKILMTVSLFLAIISVNAQNTADYSQTGGDCNCDATYEGTTEGYNWYRTPMNPQDFNDLKSIISQRTFESTKLDFAKSAIDENYFITDQVRELLPLFTFESSKMEIAKYVYGRTLDRKNYFKLYDLFDFESSVTELHDFIKTQKH